MTGVLVFTSVGEMLLGRVCIIAGIYVGDSECRGATHCEKAGMSCADPTLLY